MEIKVFIEKSGKKVNVILPSKATIRALLEKLGINPVNALVSVNGEICIEQEALNDKDNVEIFSVVSGG